jgi:hypothetical protein
LVLAVFFFFHLKIIVYQLYKIVDFVMIFFTVLGFKLRAYTVNHSTSPFL